MDSKFYKLRKTYSDSVTSAAVGDDMQLTARSGQVLNWTLVCTVGTLNAELRYGSATGSVFDQLYAVVTVNPCEVSADIYEPFKTLWVTWDAGGDGAVHVRVAHDEANSEEVFNG